MRELVGGIYDLVASCQWQLLSRLLARDNLS
jgi:hypothetical protein